LLGFDVVGRQTGAAEIAAHVFACHGGCERQDPGRAAGKTLVPAACRRGAAETSPCEAVDVLAEQAVAEPLRDQARDLAIPGAGQPVDRDDRI
jgi:hypothetical protein